MSKEISAELLRIESAGGVPPSFILKKKGKSLIPEKRKQTFKVEPSSVLGSVKSFLPKLAVANRELERRLEEGSARDVDIENIEDCSQQVIEMNLAVVQQSDSDSSEPEDSVSDTDSDSDSVIILPDNGIYGEVNESNIQLPRQPSQRKEKPDIIVLGETRNSLNVEDTIPENTKKNVT